MHLWETEQKSHILVVVRRREGKTRRGNLQAHTSFCASVCLRLWCHVPSGVEPGLWEPVELLLLLLLLSLLTDKLERSFLCMRCETGDGCFLDSDVGPAEEDCVTPRGVPWPLLSTVCRPFCCLVPSLSMPCCRDVSGWGRGLGCAKEKETAFSVIIWFRPERLHSWIGNMVFWLNYWPFIAFIVLFKNVIK